MGVRMNVASEVELIKALDLFREEMGTLAREIKAIRSTVVVLDEQIIGLRNDYNDFKNDIISYRAVRAAAELQDLEARQRSTQSRIQTLKVGGTDEKIKAAVAAEMTRGAINWQSVRQAVVTGVLVSLSIGVVSILFWSLVRVLANSAP